MKKVGCIYKIENSISGKFYIGSSLNLKKRFKRHKRELSNNKHHNVYLQRAWNKYGENNFIFQKLFEDKNIKVIEQIILDCLDYSKCYNVSKSASGGDLTSNHPNKEEIIKKRAYTLSQNYKKGLVNIPDMLGDKNPNWRGGKTFCACGSRISSYSNSCLSCRDKSGRKNPFYGKRHSEETKRKISKANTGKVHKSTEKPVKIGDTEYRSVSECARQIGVVPNTVINRIRSKKFKEYSYK